jgi:glycosyltransferase involved in cell wall biosynthesis
MVAYTFYEADNRVRRYAQTLARQGHQVDAITLWRDEQPEREEWVDGVRVLRIQRRARDEKSALDYLRKLALFFFRSMFVLAREHMREPYDLIHVHSVPDFEVFAALYPRLAGSKVILDIHDILPELYASKFKICHGSPAFKLLVAVERASAAFADHIIAANHIWHGRLQERSVGGPKLTTILNFPDTDVFQRRGRSRSDRKFVMVYPGTLNHHQGVDIAVRAFARIEAKVPEAEFHIYGSGGQLTKLQELSIKLGLRDRVLFKGQLALEQIARVMENADLGVVPKRSEGFGNEAFSTKTLEFMAMGVPLIIPDTTIDKYYFNDSVAKFFHANDDQSLAEAMLVLIKDSDLREELARNATEFVKKYTWEANQQIYLALVESLLNSRRAPRFWKRGRKVPASPSRRVQS